MEQQTVACLTPTFAVTNPAAEVAIERSGGILRRVDASGDVLDSVVRVGGRDCAALIVGTQSVDRRLIERLADLRVIAKHGAGVDNIDLSAARDHGVVVTNAPGLNAVAVAEFTMGLMIAVGRGIVSEDARVRSGRWGVRIGIELAGKTLGIIGLGAIGRLVATRAAAFDMRIVWHDLHLSDTEAPTGPWQGVELRELLEQADFVTLHVPLTSETTRLIDAAALSRMKPTAVLINAARGGVIDEDALGNALRNEALGGAGLDVFAREPLTQSPLLGLPERTVLTPHMAGYTDAALAATSLATAENVAAVLRGETPPNPVG